LGVVSDSDIHRTRKQSRPKGNYSRSAEVAKRRKTGIPGDYSERHDGVLRSPLANFASAEMAVSV